MTWVSLKMLTLLTLIWCFSKRVSPQGYRMPKNPDSCYSRDVDLVIIAQHTDDVAVDRLQRESFTSIVDLFLTREEMYLRRVRVALWSLKIHRREENDEGNVKRQIDVNAATVFNFTEYHTVSDVKNALETRSLNDTDGEEFIRDSIHDAYNRRLDSKNVVIAMFLYNLSDANVVLDISTSENFLFPLVDNQILVLTDIAMSDIRSHPRIQVRQVTADNLTALNVMDDFLCRRCESQWLSVGGTSCYRFVGALKDINWIRASIVCGDGGALASMETVEEYDRLLSKISAVFEMFPDLQEIQTIDIFINLKKSKESLAQHFTWGSSRPVVFDRWVSDKTSKCPVCGDCAVLTFRHVPNSIGNTDSNDWYTVIGWRETGCSSSRSSNISINAALCEWEHEDYNKGKEPLKLTPLAYEHRKLDDVMSLGNYGRYEASKKGSLFLRHYMPTLEIVCVLLNCENNKFRKYYDELPIITEPGSDTILDINDTKWSNLPALTNMNDVLNFDFSRMMFRCDNQWIPYSYVCDRKINCNDGSDESLCGVLTDNTKSDFGGCDPVREHTCRNGRCIPKEAVCDLYDDCEDNERSDEQNCKCTAWKCESYTCIPFHYDREGCVDVSRGKSEIGNAVADYNSSPCTFICERRKCLQRRQLGDGKVDCHGPEGHIDETWGRLDTIYNCFEHEEIWSPRCILLRDRFGEIIGCRSMKHLEKCADFVCPEGYAKCPKAHCIPVHAVRDGKKDCPEGEDEDVFEQGPYGLYHPQVTIGMFACDSNYKYIHPELVCDGLAQCRDKSDELHCGVTCTEGFLCLGDAVVTLGYNFSKALTNLSFIDHRVRFLNLSQVKVPTFFQDYPKGHMRHLLYLILAECSMESIERTKDMSNLDKEVQVDFITVVKLDLSGNRLSIIGNNSILSNMSQLVSLNLSRNTLLTSISLASTDVPLLEELDLSFSGINHLSHDCFANKNFLKRVNLHNTRIIHIDVRFPVSLGYLDLRIPTLRIIEPGSFKDANGVEDIRTSSYRFCCPQIIGPTKKPDICHAPADNLSSCMNLMREPVLRVLLWVVGLTALLGNLVVIVYRLVMEKNKGLAFKTFVWHLSVSDILMGVYLLIIAAMDTRFRGQYVLHERQWRSSDVCHIAGFLSTISSETSAMFILLITLDRFLVTKFPFGQIRFTKWTTRVSCCTAWLVGFLLALLPVLPPFHHWAIYSTNSMCLGLPFSVHRLPGWQYSVAVFVGFNFVIFLLIAWGQIAIYKSISSNKLSLESSKQLIRRKQDIAIAKRLSLIVVSDFLCWFPIGIMGLLALSGYEIGDVAYSWSAVVVLPINSALNPLLYTMGAVREKWKKRQEENTQMCDDLRPKITDLK